MKRIIKKTYNNKGEKCKQYIYDYDNSIIIYKYTLIPNHKFKNMFGGETIIKSTKNYMVTFHRFAIKKQTLLEALTQFNLISN